MTSTIENPNIENTEDSAAAVKRGRKVKLTPEERLESRREYNRLYQRMYYPEHRDKLLQQRKENESFTTKDKRMGRELAYYYAHREEIKEKRRQKYHEMKAILRQVAEAKSAALTAAFADTADSSDGTTQSQRILQAGSSIDVVISETRPKASASKVLGELYDILNISMDKRPTNIDSIEFKIMFA